jgi:NTE family protein
VNNLPVQPLLGKVDKIIGVNVNPVKVEPVKYSARNYTDRLIHIGIRANIQNAIAQCDLFIEPPGLMQYHLFKLSAAQKIFESGYEYTKNTITSEIAKL